MRTDHVAFDETLADSKTIILLVDGEHSVLIPALGLDAIELSDEAVAGLADARWVYTCLLYTSDAADERSSVDLGGRRIIKKKKTINHNERRERQLQYISRSTGLQKQGSSTQRIHIS